MSESWIRIHSHGRDHPMAAGHGDPERARRAAVAPRGGTRAILTCACRIMGCSSLGTVLANSARSVRRTATGTPPIWVVRRAPEKAVRCFSEPTRCAFFPGLDAGRPFNLAIATCLDVPCWTRKKQHQDLLLAKIENRRRLTKEVVRACP